MALSSGDTLGPYEILALVGKGGMGEVYRARDTRLDRDVAVKVSATEFSERFTREARSIAALNHSNVCHLYDVGPDYLVLEYVEGASPAGPLPFDEALPIIKQLIDGIEAAHEKNIIHRDLKTANIRITPEGVVKILDFGLAKAGEPESPGDVANSPTITMDATQAGTILGTAAYMAPEQAKGKAADRRSDIWSFGVVVYELLVGRPPFEGEGPVDILGAVINKEPDWSRVPPRAARLLRSCLQKDRRTRLAAISDARLLLDTSAVEQPAASTKKSGRLLWPAIAAVLLLGAGFSTYEWWRATRPVDRPLARLSVDLGRDAMWAPRGTVSLSPDGTRIVFVGQAPDGTRQLYTRQLDQPTATALTGTTFGVSLSAPFFSPDGDWIGFVTGNAIKKVSPQGGAVVQVADLGETVLGASWGDDGNIIIGAQSALLRVPSTGGKPVPLKSGPLKFFPHVLPGARAVLVNSFGGPTLDALDDLRIDVSVIETGETKTLINSGYDPRYLPTSGRTGHLVYVSRGTLFGVAFDPERLETSGTPVPLINDVGNPNVLTGGAQFTFSKTGTLAYLAGRTTEAPYPIQWLNAAGQLTPLLTQTATYGTPRLSPDGSRLAYTMATGKGGDVWVYDLQRDAPVQLTFTGPGLREIAWSPDSKHLVYGDGAALWWTRADGSGQAQRILEKAANPRPFSISREGRLVFTAFGTAGLPDVFVLRLDLSDLEHPKAGTPEVFVNEPTVEVDPAFSPDGKFLAYVTTELGPNAVFVRPYPGPGGKWNVSVAGGKFPVWSPTTKDLYFLAPDDRIMVASYTIDGNSFVAGRPRVWSPIPILRDGVRQNFDMSPDGTRAVVFPQPASAKVEGSLHATFLLNFFDEVRRRIP